MHDVEGTGVPFSGHDGTHPPGVPPARHHAEISGLELDEVHDLAGVDVETNGVVHLDEGIRVADGTPVTRVQVGHILGSGLDRTHAAQLVLRLLGSNAVNSEAPLDVVYETKVLAGLLDLNDVHEASGKSWVSTDLNREVVQVTDRSISQKS